MKKLSFIVLAALMLIGCSNNGGNQSNVIKTDIPQRAAGQTDVVGLRCEALPTVRVGFIGLGMRGPGAVDRFTHIEGV